MPRCGLQVLELELHLLPQLEVERAERLVEQQHPGPVDQRPGQRHALLLPAASWRGDRAPELLQLHHRERLASPAPPARPRARRRMRRPYSTFSRTLMWGNSA